MSCPAFLTPVRLPRAPRRNRHCFCRVKSAAMLSRCPAILEDSMILAARAQPTSAHARAPPTPRSCCASGSPPIRRPLHESDDPDGIVHRDLRLTLLIFESGLNCSHEGLRFVILHEPLAAVLLPTRIGTNLASQLDQHRAPRKADCRHFVSPIRTHMTESYCFGESRGKVNGGGCCDRESGSLPREQHSDATKRLAGRGSQTSGS